MTLFFRDHLKKNFEDLFCLRSREKNFEDLIIIIFFGEHLRLCPCPGKSLSSEGLSLALDIFCVLGLEPCALDYTFVHLSQILSLFRLSPISTFIQTLFSSPLETQQTVHDA